MKRLLSVLLLAALLLLGVTGCGQSPASGGAGSGASSAPAPASSGVVSRPDPIREPDPEPAAPARSPTDYDNRFSSMTGASVADVEGAWVFMPLWASNLFYADPATGDCGPLCGKPECTHTDKDCSSYVGSNGQFVNYYDGKLYYLASFFNQAKRTTEYGLWRQDPDGTNREFLADFLQGFQDEFGVPYNLIVHRGSVYIQTRKQTVKDAAPVESFLIVRADLQKPDEFTLLAERSSGFGLKGCTCVAEDYLYLCISTWTEELGVLRNEVFRIDRKTGAEEPLFLAEDADWNVYTMFVTDEGVIYLSANISPWDNGHPVVFRLEGGELVTVADLGAEEEHVANAVFTDGLIVSFVVREWNSTGTMGFVYDAWVLDLEGNTLYKGVWEPQYRQIPADQEFPDMRIVLGGEKDYFLIFFRDGINYVAYLVRYDVTPEGLRETVLCEADVGLFVTRIS